MASFSASVPTTWDIDPTVEFQEFHWGSIDDLREEVLSWEEGGEFGNVSAQTHPKCARLSTDYCTSPQFASLDADLPLPSEEDIPDLTSSGASSTTRMSPFIRLWDIEMPLQRDNDNERQRAQQSAADDIPPPAPPTKRHGRPRSAVSIARTILISPTISVTSRTKKAPADSKSAKRRIGQRMSPASILSLQNRPNQRPSTQD